MSSCASAVAVSRAAACSSSAATTRSRKPAATAASGEYTSARFAARAKSAGVNRLRRISIAAHGSVRPIATSFAVIL